MHKNFVAITAAALSLSLYAPPAACGEEAGGSEVSEEPGCEPKPLWYTEEARIMRQKGAASGPWCVEEPRADRHRDSQQETSPGLNAGTISATAMGTAGGIVSGFTSVFFICFQLEGGDLGGWDCMSTPSVLGGGLAGGLAGGYLGYQNNRAVLSVGGSVSGFVLGMGLLLFIDPSGVDDLAIPVALLSATAGGYLGHRLWKVREANGARYSLSPYLHDEGSGLMLAGRF